MKRIKMLLFIISTVLFLSGCNIGEVNISDKISTPNNNNTPILGKWKITEYIYGDEDNLEKEDLYLNKEGLFHKDVIIVADNYITEPTFKFKKVKTEDYLLYKYKINPGSLNLNNDEIQIISVFKDNQYFYEFIKLDDNNLILRADEKFYKMEKVQDEVDIAVIEKYLDTDGSEFRDLETKKTEENQSGVLLGIKTPIYDEENDVPQWEYKTLWINYQDEEIGNIYVLDNLLVPRKNGFWMVNVNREIKNRNINDSINMEPKFTAEDKKETNNQVFTTDSDKIRPKRNLTVLKNILYIGNDYISIENIDNSLDQKRTLKVYGLDNIKDEKPVKLSDIVGEEGKAIFEEGAENILSLDSAVFNESNIGLVRKNGYWGFKGRVNYKQNNEELYKDFDIKAIPPKEMINHDELVIPWNKLKTRLPQARDVYSSPNEDIIIVKTSSFLLIYPISNQEISGEEPLRRIPLPDNSSIVMAEWSSGAYTDIWEEEFIKNGGNIIED